MHKVGDKFLIEATGDFAPGIVCEILQLNDNGTIKKAKAVYPDERLARMGFLIEGNDYVILEWNWSEN